MMQNLLHYKTKDVQSEASHDQLEFFTEWYNVAIYELAFTPYFNEDPKELAGLLTKLDSTYSTGKFDYKGKQITLNDAEDVLAESRDPAELKAAWEGWHGVATVMKPDYARFAARANLFQVRHHSTVGFVRRPAVACVGALRGSDVEAGAPRPLSAPGRGGTPGRGVCAPPGGGGKRGAAPRPGQ